MHNTHESLSGRKLAAVSLAALGVVFGDIGTSPLYAIRECFHGEYGIAVTQGNVLGVLSLVFWALLLVVSLKYLVFIMRADNDGEGGVLALTALVRPKRGVRGVAQWALVAMGLFAACLLYGDGMITPAISVLSAVEGLGHIAPMFGPYVIHVTLVILVGLFLLQSHGTARVGTLFGPIILVWFGVLAVLGLVQTRSIRRFSRLFSPGTPWPSSSKTACTALSCSARSSWWSRVRRPFMRTWAISAAAPSD
jgi:KUP system potassium uptake protein